MKTRAIIAILAAALVLAGCQKDEFVSRRGMNDSPVRYVVALERPVQSRAETGNGGMMLSLTGNGDSLSMPMEWIATEGIDICPASDGTKGTLVNTTGSDDELSAYAATVGSFIVKAYNGGTENVSQTVVTWSGSEWEAAEEAIWPKGTSLDFLAYANLPGSQTATITKDGVSTVHTVPASAANQKDILFGHYQGNGGSTHTAEIRFEHPLTAVRFKYGEMDGNPTVKSIRLDGVAQTGTAAMAADGTISWSGIGTRNYSVSQSSATGLSVNSTTHLIGEPFIIIPQNLAAHSVKVTITFTDETEVFATLNSGEWEAGYTNTYTLGLSETVDVQLTDRVLSGVKDNVVIRNTGNVKCYIRAALAANWFDDNGIIVAPWSYDASNPVAAGFTSLPSDASGSGARWIYNAGDGFYYFTSPVLPGETTSSALFNSFSSTAASPVEGSHLEMMLMVQGVAYDSSKIKASTAWGAAVTGYLSK